MRSVRSVLAVAVLAGGAVVLPAVGASAATCKQSVAMHFTHATVRGGATDKGTVTLHCTVKKKTKVTIRTWHKGLTAPKTVTIKAHHKTATFTLHTPKVSKSTSVLVRAAYGKHHADKHLTLTPVPKPITPPPTTTPKGPAVSSLAANGPFDYYPDGVVRPNQPATLTVKLAGLAPYGGTELSLTSDNPDVVVPAHVTVPWLRYETTFQVTALPNDYRGYPVTITATAPDGSQATGYEDIYEAGVLKYFSIANPAMVGSVLTTGSYGNEAVDLTAPATEPVTIDLSSNNPDVTVPSQIVVPTGATQATFTLTVGPLSADEHVALTASVGSESTSTFGLEVHANAVREIAVNQSIPQLAVALTLVTSDAGATVALTSSDPSLLAVPDSVQVPPDKAYATVPIQLGQDIPAGAQVTLTGTLDGRTYSQIITLDPPTS